MQIISGMQRNRSNLQPLTSALGVFLLVGYEVATTQLVFLPPLIGLFFAYLVLETTRMQSRYEKFGASWYFALVFIVFAEQIHGFYLFSSIVAFLLFFSFVSDWLAPAIKWHSWLLAIYVVSGYFWTFCVHELIAYIKGEELLKFSGEYLLYVAIETILAILFLRKSTP